jgi:TonB family protein
VIQLLLCFALLLANGSVADKKSDKQQDGFKGPVGSVRIEKAEIKNENGKSVEGQRVRSEKLRYSEKGELAERIYYNGDWISSVRFFQNDTFGVKQEVVFERNHTANSAAQVTKPAEPQLAEKYVFKHVSQYDNKGNRIENAVFSEFDHPFGKDIYVFDDKGNNVEFKSYKENGRLVHKSTYTFNNKGAIATSTSYDETDKIIVEKRSYTHEFDGQGNWIKQITSKVLANGKAEPFEVHYRTISYFPPVGNFKEGGIVGGVSKEDAEKNNPNIIIRKGGVLAGSATRFVEPSYPPLAQAARIKGAVIVEVVVDEEGDVLTARALEGHPLLKVAAERAALGWKFTPTLLDGVPVRVVGTVTFNFNL